MKLLRLVALARLLSGALYPGSRLQVERQNWVVYTDEYRPGTRNGSPD